ncbi:hypothetical protein ACOSP6_08985 [Tenacibaculum sp. MEBiC06402]|uniref:hypothetical protein n=1 Tax=unclassified Tenacibaculum TaxID=2635139 RepID=UPI003B9CEEBE
MASKSQITFNKKQKEKQKAQKKKAKMEKRELKKTESSNGLKINWSIAPKNRTLTPNDKASKEAQRIRHINV